MHAIIHLHSDSNHVCIDGTTAGAGSSRSLLPTPPSTPASTTLTAQDPRDGPPVTPVKTDAPPALLLPPPPPLSAARSSVSGPPAKLAPAALPPPPPIARAVQPATGPRTSMFIPASAGIPPPPPPPAAQPREPARPPPPPAHARQLAGLPPADDVAVTDDSPAAVGPAGSITINNSRPSLTPSIFSSGTAAPASRPSGPPHAGDGMQLPAPPPINRVASTRVVAHAASALPGPPTAPPPLHKIPSARFARASALPPPPPRPPGDPAASADGMRPAIAAPVVTPPVSSGPALLPPPPPLPGAAVVARKRSPPPAMDAIPLPTGGSRVSTAAAAVSATAASAVGMDAAHGHAEATAAPASAAPLHDERQQPADAVETLLHVPKPPKKPNRRSLESQPPADAPDHAATVSAPVTATASDGSVSRALTPSQLVDRVDAPTTADQPDVSTAAAAQDKPALPSPPKQARLTPPRPLTTPDAAVRTLAPTSPLRRGSAFSTVAGDTTSSAPTSPPPLPSRPLKLQRQSQARLTPTRPTDWEDAVTVAPTQPVNLVHAHSGNLEQIAQSTAADTPVTTPAGPLVRPSAPRTPPRAPAAGASPSASPRMKPPAPPKSPSVTASSVASALLTAAVLPPVSLVEIPADVPTSAVAVFDEPTGQPAAKSPQRGISHAAAVATDASTAHNLAPAAGFTPAAADTVVAAQVGDAVARGQASFATAGTAVPPLRLRSPHKAGADVAPSSSTQREDESARSTGRRTGGRHPFPPTIDGSTAVDGAARQLHALGVDATSGATTAPTSDAKIAANAEPKRQSPSSRRTTAGAAPARAHVQPTPGLAFGVKLRSSSSSNAMMKASATGLTPRVTAATAADAPLQAAAAPTLAAVDCSPPMADTACSASDASAASSSSSDAVATGPVADARTATRRSSAVAVDAVTAVPQLAAAPQLVEQPDCPAPAVQSLAEPDGHAVANDGTARGPTVSVAATAASTDSPAVTSTQPHPAAGVAPASTAANPQLGEVATPSMACPDAGDAQLQLLSQQPCPDSPSAATDIGATLATCSDSAAATVTCGSLPLAPTADVIIAASAHVEGEARPEQGAVVEADSGCAGSPAATSASNDTSTAAPLKDAVERHASEPALVTVDITARSPAPRRWDYDELSRRARGHVLAAAPRQQAVAQQLSAGGPAGSTHGDTAHSHSPAAAVPAPASTGRPGASAPLDAGAALPSTRMLNRALPTGMPAHLAAVVYSILQQQQAAARAASATPAGRRAACAEEVVAAAAAETTALDALAVGLPVGSKHVNAGEPSTARAIDTADLVNRLRRAARRKSLPAALRTLSIHEQSATSLLAAQNAVAHAATGTPSMLVSFGSTGNAPAVQLLVAPASECNRLPLTSHAAAQRSRTQSPRRGPFDGHGATAPLLAEGSRVAAFAPGAPPAVNVQQLLARAEAAIAAVQAMQVSGQAATPELSTVHGPESLSAHAEPPKTSGISRAGTVGTRRASGDSVASAASTTSARSADSESTLPSLHTISSLYPITAIHSAQSTPQRTPAAPMTASAAVKAAANEQMRAEVPSPLLEASAAEPKELSMMEPHAAEPVAWLPPTTPVEAHAAPFALERVAPVMVAAGAMASPGGLPPTMHVQYNGHQFPSAPVYTSHMSGPSFAMVPCCASGYGSYVGAGMLLAAAPVARTPPGPMLAFAMDQMPHAPMPPAVYARTPAYGRIASELVMLEDALAVHRASTLPVVGESVMPAHATWWPEQRTAAHELKPAPHAFQHPFVTTATPPAADPAATHHVAGAAAAVAGLAKSVAFAAPSRGLPARPSAMPAAQPAAAYRGAFQHAHAGTSGSVVAAAGGRVFAAPASVPQRAPASDVRSALVERLSSVLHAIPAHAVPPTALQRLEAAAWQELHAAEQALQLVSAAPASPLTIAPPAAAAAVEASARGRAPAPPSYASPTSASAAKAGNVFRAPAGRIPGVPTSSGAMHSQQKPWR